MSGGVFLAALAGSVNNGDDEEGDTAMRNAPVLGHGSLLTAAPAQQAAALLEMHGIVLYHVLAAQLRPAIGQRKAAKKAAASLRKKLAFACNARDVAKMEDIALRVSDSPSRFAPQLEIFKRAHASSDNALSLACRAKPASSSAKR